MHWYGGSMAEAVTLSKQRNAIFVVFVEDDNNLSKELASTIDDSVVVERLKDPNNFLAVKLMSGSENYTYFAQIYQFVPVPSLFFIGRNGTPLEVVCAGVEPHNLATRIDRILQEHRKEQESDSVQPSTSSRDIKNETVNFLQTEATVATAQAEVKGPLALTKKSTPEHKESTAQTPNNAPEPLKSTPDAPKSSPDAPKSSPDAPKSSPDVPKSPDVSKSTPKASKSTPAVDEEPESSGPAAKVQKTGYHNVSGGGYEVVCEGDVCVRKPRQGTDGAGSSQESKPAPMEESASTEEKIEKAKELIEITRREKAAKEKEAEKQKEMERRSVGQGVAELKRWQADQEMKQIQEDRKREKLENDLARQRILEQIAQDRAERRAREAPPPQTEAPPPRTDAPPANQGPATAGDCTRVLFKLLDGGSHVATFPSGAPLSAVRQYVTDHLQPDCPFSLWTAFPRQRLEDASASLLQLQLAPSAALLVLPAGAPVVRPAPPGGLLAFLTTMFTSLILNPSYQLYFWIRGRIFPTPAEATDVDQPRASSPPRPDQTRPRPAGMRRRGNVHRLTGDGNSDDDNNTWNGNSTQQM